MRLAPRCPFLISLPQRTYSFSPRRRGRNVTDDGPCIRNDDFSNWCVALIPVGRARPGGFLGDD